MIRKASTCDLDRDVDPNAVVGGTVAASDSWEELSVDVDADALTRKPSRRQRVGTWFPDGPSTLDACVDWASSGLRALAMHDLVSRSVV